VLVPAEVLILELLELEVTEEEEAAKLEEEELESALAPVDVST
jgi:hypothetical protein